MRPLLSSCLRLGLLALLLILSCACDSGLLLVGIAILIALPLRYSLFIDDDNWARQHLKEGHDQGASRAKLVLRIFFKSLWAPFLILMATAMAIKAGWLKSQIVEQSEHSLGYLVASLYLSALFCTAAQLMLAHFHFFIRLCASFLLALLCFFNCFSKGYWEFPIILSSLMIYAIPACLHMAAYKVQRPNPWRLFFWPSLLVMGCVCLIFRDSSYQSNADKLLILLIALLLTFQSIELLQADEKQALRNSLLTLAASLLLVLLAATGTLLLGNSYQALTECVQIAYKGLSLIYTLQVGLIIWRSYRLPMQGKEVITLFSSVFGFTLAFFTLLLAWDSNIPLLPLFSLGDDVTIYDGAIRYELIAGMLVLIALSTSINIDLAKRRASLLASPKSL